MITAQDKKSSDISSYGDYTKYIRFAKVTTVYDTLTYADKDTYGTVALMWLDTGAPINGPVSYLKTGYSSNYGYGIIVVPSVGDIAACYCVSGAQPIILGFFSRHQFESAFADKSNTASIAHIEPLKSGEILIKGKSQSSIIFKNDGRVNISIKDGTNRSSVLNQDLRRTNETFQEKSSDKENNTVLDVSLGLSDQLAGPGRQIISCTTGPALQQTFEISAIQNTLTYTLPNLNGVDVLGIESVKIYLEKDGKRLLQKALDQNSDVSLVKSYYYKQGINHEISRDDTCSMDTNGVVTSVILPTSVGGLLKSGVVIQITLFIKRPSFSLKVNEFGDLLINCRNAVIQAEDGKSQFGVMADSSIVANAVKATIGNKLTGCIRTDRDGLHLSSGSFTNADIEEIKPKNVKDMTEDVFYFYITDEFPLIAYNPDNKGNEFTIVGADVYCNLSDSEKARIMCKPFDYTVGVSSTDGFTRTKMDKLLAQAYKDNKTVVTYGELKML